MYVHIKPTRKLRVLSFILSIVLLWSAVMQNLVVFGVTITSSTTSTNDINKTNTYTSTNPYKGVAATDGSGLSYTYTGNITTASVNLYDYKSDDEINGAPINSAASGFTDPYTKLNKAISESDVNGTPLHASSTNITIKLTTTSFTSDVYVRPFRVDVNESTIEEVAWPGFKMEYDDSDDCYTYTFNRTDSTSIYYLGFTPNRLVFNDNGSPALKTKAVSVSMQIGNTYSYNESKDNKIVYKFNPQYYDTTYPYYSLYYWVGSTNNGWPGTNMTPYGSDYYFTYTYGGSGDIPENFIICGRDAENGSEKWQSDNLPYDSIKTEVGFTYDVRKLESNHNSPTVDKYLSNVTLTSSTEPAESINNSNFPHRK